MVVVALVASLVGACQSDGPDATSDPTQSPSQTLEQGEPTDYVALGDSYTAAPLVPTTDTEDSCFRSDGNYPHLLAARLPRTRLTDVSCSGADTADMTGPQAIGGQTKPPQLDAVSEETDLVTIGIGGNDFGLFGTMSLGCFRLASSDPRGAPCRDANQQADGDRLLDLVPRIQRRVAAVLEEIHERAPDAIVVVVGYPRLLPPTGSCPDRVPLAAGDQAYVAEVNKALSDALLAAAEDSDALAVDVYAASRGHDVCSDQPWVNGVETTQGALALHPFAAEQEAVADLILDQVLDQL